ncbi:hypothetical protein C8R42DRAFT_381509 [Lentinula raphanica]|nr:hypothetical protein C8R42DRAFT_381509 [Lentinula raphanica]
MMLFRPFSMIMVLCPLSLVFAAPTGGKPPQDQAGQSQDPYDYYYVWFSDPPPPFKPPFTHVDVPDIVHEPIRRHLNIPKPYDNIHIQYLENFPLALDGMFQHKFHYSYQNLRTKAIGKGEGTKDLLKS